MLSRLLIITTITIVGISSNAYSVKGQSLNNQIIAQKIDPNNPADLERQREIERTLKEAERVRRETTNTNQNYNNYRTNELKRQAEEQVTKIRNSGGNQTIIDSTKTEIERIDRENQRYNRRPYYDWYPDYYYRTSPAPVIIYDRSNPAYYDNSPSYNYKRNSGSSKTKFIINAGGKDGAVSTAIGARFGNIGFAGGIVFNQDEIKGILNPYPLPNFLAYDDLGLKRTSVQVGGDVLGYFDISPQVSLYGGIGIYGNTQSQIVKSKASQENYKQTDETKLTPAISGGIDANVGDGVSVGVGYHSIRGITGQISVGF